MSTGGQNKRRFPRKRCDSNVRLFFDGVYAPGKMVDIGEGGMMMHTAALLEPKQHILVHFQIGQTAVRAKAEVLYVLTGGSETGGFRVGMRFTSISDFGVEVIRHYSPELT